MKHLLKLADLDKGDILDILNLADQLKYENQHGIEHHHLKGKTLGMIFQKSSTRTRVSFETGMYQLGGQALFLSNRDLQIGRGEPVQDTARVLSRYLDGIMIRTFAQKEVEDLAEYGSIPIINGLTDYCHPCQVLADLMTIREYKKSFDGLKFCFIGDGNNMANSLIVGAISMGMECAIACPKDYQPDAQIMAWAKENARVSGLSDAPIRWIVDDCAKFVEREIRRGKTYDAIIMDPPSYGRGPSGEVWKLEDNLYPFVKLCMQVLSDKPLFVIINSYTTGLAPSVLGYILHLLACQRFGGKVMWDELGLPCTESGMALPCGATGRWVSE